MGYKWSLTTTIFLFSLTILGAVVVGLNAVLACPHWPLCGNSLIPKMSVPVLVEYFHRLITFVTTLLILYNAWRTWRKRKDILARSLAVASVVLLGTQIALGAIIVLLVLPGAFTTIDVANSMLLLASVAALTAIGIKERRDELVKQKGGPIIGASGLPLLQEKSMQLRNPILLVTITAFVETVIGAYFRHSGDSQALFGQDSYLLSHHQHHMPSYYPSLWWLVIHIGVSASVGIAVIWLISRAFKVQSFIGTSIALGILLVYQMLIGLLSLATKLAVYLDTMHFGGAALMVSLSVYLVTQVFLEAPYKSHKDDVASNLPPVSFGPNTDLKG